MTLEAVVFSYTHFELWDNSVYSLILCKNYDITNIKATIISLHRESWLSSRVMRVELIVQPSKILPHKTKMVQNVRRYTK